MSGELNPDSVKPPQSEELVGEPREIKPPQIEEASMETASNDDLSVKPPEMG